MERVGPTNQQPNVNSAEHLLHMLSRVWLRRSGVKRIMGRQPLLWSATKQPRMRTSNEALGFSLPSGVGVCPHCNFSYGCPPRRARCCQPPCWGPLILGFEFYNVFKLPTSSPEATFLKQDVGTRNPPRVLILSSTFAIARQLFCYLLHLR